MNEALREIPLIQIQRNSGTVRLKLQKTSQFHRFDTELGRHILLVNGSRIFTLPDEIAQALEDQPEKTEEIFEKFGLIAPDYITDEPVENMPVRSLSLAVAQKCNLGCTYCYAQEGNFGSKNKDMSAEVASASVDLLFSEVLEGETVSLAFLGGEPLTNRELVRRCTLQALALAKTKNAKLNFSITTNGTLVTSDDGEFFERYGFAVTVSLDGIGKVHNRLRSFKSGKESYNRIIENIRPLLKIQRNMQVSARVTVTPDNLFLRESLNEFLALGFHSVGFSPMLASPTGKSEMNAKQLDTMLEQMISCGEEFERRIAAGERFAFLNMINALREIHKGTHRPYPCGAGGGYLGVSADGGLYACHRFVEDKDGAMGEVWNGVDRTKQNRWLAERHVHLQEPCRNCWARYLCGGGCHHEVIKRGRPACEYIRGWLNYCLQAYIRLLEQRPDYFGV